MVHREPAYVCLPPVQTPANVISFDPPADISTSSTASSSNSSLATADNPVRQETNSGRENNVRSVGWEGRKSMQLYDWNCMQYNVICKHPSELVNTNQRKGQQASSKACLQPAVETSQLSCSMQHCLLGKPQPESCRQHWDGRCQVFDAVWLRLRHHQTGAHAPWPVRACMQHHHHYHHHQTRDES